MRANAKILIIDDEQTSQMIVSEFFTQYGFQVITAEDGQAGIDQVNNERFDLIFLDLNMPRMSGTQALPHILDIDPHARVIIMTAFASYESKLETREQGAYDYLVKPLTPAKLEEVTEKALPERRHPSGEAPPIQKIRIDPGEMDHAVARIIPERMARAFFLIPIAKHEDTLTVAMADPFDMVAIDTLKSHTGFDIRPVQVDRREILKALETTYVDQDTPDQPASDLEIMPGAESGRAAPEPPKEKSDEARTRKRVNAMLSRAIQHRASSIHIDPGEKTVSVRMRIGRILQELPSYPRPLHADVVSRVASIAKIDADDPALPREGCVRIRFKDRHIELRVTLLPTVQGEAMVIRIADKAPRIPDITALGFDDRSLSLFLEAIQRPCGLILLSGPPGSGITTTLYGALQRLNTRDRKVVTVEDPVERRLEGISQIQVHPAAGMTMRRALQAALRQDPDAVMIGDLHDRETAEIAVHAALTGRLVLAALHAHDALSGVMRLMDMGNDAFFVGDSLNVVVAQRLVLRICSACKTETQPSRELLDRVASHTRNASIGTCYAGSGCEKCNNTGYQGHTAIFEVLPVTGRIREVLGAGGHAAALREERASMDGATLMESGLAKAARGETTLEAVLDAVE